MKDNQRVIELKADGALRSDDFVSVYTNNTQFAYTKWDFQMICGRIGFSLDPKTAPIEELALITMSPEHAKAVLKALTDSLESYEEDHGKLAERKDRESSSVLASVAKPKS